jgi:hypothetical protein
MEVDRGGTFINHQCGSERSGCSWCTASSCYKVTTCTDQKCTVASWPRSAIVKRQPVLHGGYTNPVGPTLPSTHKH